MSVVMIAPHHGVANGSPSYFIKAVQPAFVPLLLTQRFFLNSRRSFLQIASNEICNVSSDSQNLGMVAAEEAIR